MKKYFYLQLKRTFKVFPFVFAVMLALVSAVGAIVYGFVSTGENVDENKRFKVAITGDTDAKYIEMGTAAMQSMDDTRFSMEIVIMEQKEAERSLAKGEISAFVIMPENFVERALYGDMDKVTYVTSAGAETVATMFKNEITKVISDIVFYTQKGSYAIDDAVNDSLVPDPAGKYMNELSIEYVDLILNRSDTLNVEELGDSSAFSLFEYYIGALLLVVLLLSGLPFVTVHVKRDMSLNCLLVSKGFSDLKQMLTEISAHFLNLLSLCATLFTSAFILLKAFKIQAISNNTLIGLFFAIIPVVIMIACFNIAVFEISGNTISAVLIHFFSVLALCYITGCFYPIYTFPETVQRFSRFLPVSAAREYISHFVSDGINAGKLLAVLLYSFAFFILAVLLRRFKTVNKRGQA